MSFQRVSIGFGLAAALLVAPASAHADAFKPSKKDQVSLGKRAAADIEKKQKIVSQNDPRVILMRQIADKILAANPIAAKDPWEFKFNLIEDKQLNAFALPGGPIYFYTGLFDKFTTIDQIAGVLSHEMTHVRKEHWAYAYADQQKRQLGLTALLILLKAGRTAADIASISNDLLVTLPYMRKHESEADNLGYEAMVKAGYNPQGMADAFKILIANSKGGKTPEFVSTHPDTAKRVQSIEKKVANAPGPFPPQVNTPWAPTR